MKKLILLLTLLFGVTKLSAQTKIQGLDNSVSIGGMFENVFDQYGNKYTLDDIKTDTPKKSKLNNTSLSSNSLCTTGIFELYFEDGSGMEVVSNPTQNAINSTRRAVACQVFTDLSNFINTPLKDAGNATKVKIWVRDIDEVVSSSNEVLGLATSFYNMPYNTTVGFGGIADNEIWKTIHAGKDSYINVAPPIISNGISSGASGLLYHGMMAFNFNSISNWNTNLNINTPAGQIDLYSVILHEVTHALGFASLINQNGVSKFGNGYNYFTRYDRFLKNNSNSQFLINTPTSCSMYNYRFNPSLSTTILRPSCTLANNINTGTPLGTTICGNALRFVGSTINVPIYTPICYEQSSSYSHFEDMCIGVPNQNNSNSYFVMTDAMSTGQTKRFFKAEERNALGDIGYQLNTTFGNDTTAFGSYKDYGGVITTGINVAGINDGIIVDLNTFTYTGNISTNITISGILDNDYNAIGFECLQDVFSSSTLSATSGNSLTNITFNSSSAGIHLLRYIPINSLGQKGNISYIYVNVNYPPQLNSCTPTVSLCNLINNGNFEQKSTSPFIADRINYACGWVKTNYSQQPALYSYDFPTTHNVPCNNYGYEPDKFINNTYASLNFANNYYNSLFYDSAKTTLNNPLLPNKQYQLSFDVSLSDGASANAIKFQACLTSINYQEFAGFVLPINQSGNIFLESQQFSTITDGWETVVLNFTTGNISGEKYLYLGGLNNVKFKSNTPTAFNPICNYSNLTNFEPYVTFQFCSYYLDNVSLIPVESEFILPNSVCSTQALSNLNTYVSPQMPNGTFSGSGVSLNNDTGFYSFNANAAGLGVKTLTYTYTNNLNCLVNVYSQITVSDCSTTSCPGNLVFDTIQPTTPANYQAAIDIVTNGNYIVNSGSTIDLKAGNSITIDTDSWIKNGSLFLAEITDCIQTSERSAYTNEENSFDSEQLTLFPNPANAFFTVKTQKFEITKIEVASIEGKIIYHKDNVNNKEFQLHAENYQNGIYLVSVETSDGKIFTQKLVKN